MLNNILNWLATEFNIPVNDITLLPLAGDASTRKYYRFVYSTHKYIVMQQAIDDSFHNFIKIAKQLQSWGLNVPEIFKANYAHGYLVLTDFGDELYLTNLTTNLKTADNLYNQAINALLMMQTKDITALNNTLNLPVMDHNYLTDRLAVFKTWFLRQHLNLNLSQKLENLWLNLTNLITETYANQPQSFVHLDYHSRNLIVLPSAQTETATPGIIDFQDAMIGPISYDLVSLLQDAYITWPRSNIEAWVSNYQQKAYKHGLLPTLNFKQFMYWFDLVGLHRHLKNLGVFARLHHRDSKSQYLQHIPTLITYILNTCQQYPRLTELRKFFETTITAKAV